MFNRYKRSLIGLCQKVRVVQKDPVAERNTCLYIQLHLLRKILYIEKRISQLRVNMKQQNALLKSKKVVPLRKSEVQQIRDAISKQNNLIAEYQHVLSTFKTIGDALAYIYLDKWDIKPQAFKQSPGFLSGKSGLKWELKVLKLVFSTGGIALLNDLTNCLRYGDISVARNKQSLMIEVKSGHKHNARIRRQMAALKSMRNYLNYGISDKEHGHLGQKMERMPIHSPEINYMDQINKVIKRALISPHGFCMKQVERGQYYCVSCQTNETLQKALKTIGIQNSNKLIVSFVNELKYTGIAYYPFSLSIYDPDQWYAFCCGELMIVGLVSSKVIEEKFQSHGLSVKFDLGQEFALEITRTDPNNIGKTFVSNHFLGRLFSEFLSLNWFINETIYRCDTQK